MIVIPFVLVFAYQVLKASYALAHKHIILFADPPKTVSFKLNEYTQGTASDSPTTGIMLTEIDVFAPDGRELTWGDDFTVELFKYATRTGTENGQILADDEGTGSGGYVGWVNNEVPYNVGDELVRVIPLDGKDIGDVKLSFKSEGTTPGLAVYKTGDLTYKTPFAGTDMSSQGNQVSLPCRTDEEGTLFSHMCSHPY